MKVAISRTDVSSLLVECKWSGDRTQAARKLEFSIVQDDRDPLIPVVEFDNGYTVYGADDAGNVFFVGNIYQIKRDRKKSVVEIVAYDNLFVLNRSKTTKKYSNALPEDITREICADMGVKSGNIASTGVQVSFIANAKTGYQIIMGAYTEAKKKNGKLYQCMMNGDELDVIQKGTLIDNLIFDSSKNMTESVYHESIEQIINRVIVTDDSGNGGEPIDDEESIEKYSRFQTIMRHDKEKSDEEEAKNLFKKPEREGNIVVFGDYRAKAGYSVVVKDSLFTGQFWIKSDSHTFKDGIHEMNLRLEFENLMDEEKVEQEKTKK